jgi:hypothetical protein
MPVNTPNELKDMTNVRLLQEALTCEHMCAILKVDTSED